jgi:hypothetical protein
MCAFEIIIGASVVFGYHSHAHIPLPGDMIPHIIRFMFPNLPSVPVLYHFAHRRFIITFTTICISYPLSLYRNIHKLSIASCFALCGMLIIVGHVRRLTGIPTPKR